MRSRINGVRIWPAQWRAGRALAAEIPCNRTAARIAARIYGGNPGMARISGVSATLQRMADNGLLFHDGGGCKYLYTEVRYWPQFAGKTCPPTAANDWKDEFWKECGLAPCGTVCG